MDHPIKHTNLLPRKKQAWPHLDAEAQEAAHQYPFRLPFVLAKQINWDNGQDPLGRQVLPSAKELRRVEGFTTDPLAEEKVRQTSHTSSSHAYIPGLLQKYHGRVLLQVSGQCAIHCRFCFRRHDTYADIPENMKEWAPALSLIANDSSIHEVLFSGGDPLMLADGRLTELVQHLATIPHVARLRVHSRMPVITPKRVGPTLIHWMRKTRLTSIMVIHCNHPAELNAAAQAAITRLVDSGIPVLNQSVLLKGVNDDVDTLTTLCEMLVNHRVIPYYLHRLDPVAGAAHFQIEEQRARALIAQLQARLPGYAIPRLVWEQPDQPSKTLLAPLP